jgi:hypothetical protein
VNEEYADGSRGEGQLRVRTVADLPQSIMRKHSMSTVNNVVEELAPALKELVAYLAISSQSEAFDFFSHVQRSLGEVTNEEALLDVFIMMSMMAFQAFRLDPSASMLADKILAHAEQVSHAFSADSNRVN